MENKTPKSSRNKDVLMKYKTLADLDSSLEMKATDCLNTNWKIK